MPSAVSVLPTIPAFAPDWKDKHSDLVRKDFGWKDPPTERRTRTAIDAGTGRAADEQLFSYGLVMPEKGEDGAVQESFVWEGTIGLERILPDSEHAAILEELGELFQFGLPNIGKTRAVGAVTWMDRATAPAKGSKAPANGTHIVTLQTDCLMTNPELLRGNAVGCLEAAYRDFWTEASGGVCELERFFAQQSLHGGYLAKRFAKCFGKPSYEPYLVTDRGSTFVLKVNDEAKASVKMKEWTTRGLPIPSWVEARYGKPLWKTCPFLPEVGFGEVMIDLECHSKEMPQ